MDWNMNVELSLMDRPGGWTYLHHNNHALSVSLTPSLQLGLEITKWLAVMCLQSSFVSFSAVWNVCYHATTSLSLWDLIWCFTLLHLKVIMYYNNEIVHCVPFSFQSLMHISFTVVDSLIPLMNTGDGPPCHLDLQDNGQSWLTHSQGLFF